MTISSAKEVHFESKYNSIPSEYSIDIIWCSVNNIFNEKFYEMVDAENYFKRLCIFFCQSIRFDILLKFMVKILTKEKGGYTIELGMHFLIIFSLGQ